VGASSGAYALISAQIAHMLVVSVGGTIVGRTRDQCLTQQNWREMACKVPRVLVLTLLICLDVGVSVHSVAHAQPSPTTTSYTAHLFGFAAGLLLGMLVLRHFALKTWNRAI